MRALWEMRRVIKHEMVRGHKIKLSVVERHDGAVVSALGFGSRLPKSRSSRDNCVDALSPHRLTAVGQLLTFNCLGGNCPSFMFIRLYVHCYWAIAVCQLSLINGNYYYYYYYCKSINELQLVVYCSSVVVVNMLLMVLLSVKTWRNVTSVIKLMCWYKYSLFLCLLAWIFICLFRID